jgi:hypothetical protein
VVVSERLSTHVARTSGKENDLPWSRQSSGLAATRLEWRGFRNATIVGNPTRLIHSPLPETKEREVKQRYPKLPVQVGKAQMRLLTAVITGDNDLANWVRTAVEQGQVVGNPAAIRQLKQRLDEVLEPEPQATDATATGSSAGS